MSLTNAISSLRKQNKLSQREFAEIFDVSQQSVQKWESGESTPDLDKLIKISKYFDVSLDSLVMDRNKRMIESMNYNKSIDKNFDSFSYWELYSNDLMTEYQQSVEEGLDVEKYNNLFLSVYNLPRGDIKEKLANTLFEIVMNADINSEYKYIEPNDLESIKSLRKTHTYKMDAVKKEKYKEQILGAWNGRVAGCMLGQTIEGIRSDELIPFLKETNNYPMNRYINFHEIKEEMFAKYKYSFRGRNYADLISSMQPDDDLNYLVLAQLIVDDFGRNFTAYDVSRAWLKYQTKDAYCTAEKVAFRNFINGYAPPQSAIYKNPFREFIGAQIRVDYYGYINPGNPELAAEMAFRDSSISHVKNGIYGAMFVAAMISIAAVNNNVEDIILGGLAEIPYTSRLYEECTTIYNMFKDNKDYNTILNYIRSKYDEHTEYGWCHAISNSMVVVLALLFGRGGYSKSITLAVQSAFDTDCNGATVGSIIGMAKGINSIPEYWLKPFNNKLETTIFGVGQIDINEYALKTLNHIKL